MRRKTGYMHSNCNGFIAKDEWQPNSPDLNPLDYRVSSAYHKMDDKPSTVDQQLQTRLEMIWNDLPQKHVARAVQNFHKRLQACVDKAGGYFEHLM